MNGRRCPGLHCPGCDSGGGLAALVVALAVTGAVIHAIWRTIVEAAEIAALTVLAIAGLAAVAGIGYVVLRIRASMARSRAQTGPKAVIVGEVTHGSINARPPARDRAAVAYQLAAARPAGTDPAPLGHHRKELTMRQVIRRPRGSGRRICRASAASAADARPAAATALATAAPPRHHRRQI